MRTKDVLTTPCWGAYPIDPGFPQLAIASDPDRMLEVFRDHVKPRSGRNVRILECQPYRFRCRQSTTRCVLQYTLRLLDPDTGRQWDQWVAALLYADDGEARRTWKALQAADGVAGLPEPWGCLEPVSYVPDPEMVVEVFPYDRRLPQLGRLLNGAGRDLEPLLKARLGPGRWQTRGEAIEPARYRTELGAVLRYVLAAEEAESGRQAAPCCYLKVYRNPQGRETFALLRGWWEQGGAAARGYQLVRPLAYWEELRTLVLENAPGRSLQEILLAEGEALGAVRAVARAVAAFHQGGMPIAHRYSLTEHRQDLKQATSLVQWACPEKRAKIGGVSAVVAQGLEDVQPTPIHRDLTPEHILVSENTVTFVDADSVSLGDPLRDPALLFAHIVGTLAPAAVPPERALRLAGAFIEEYFAWVPSSWRPRFRLHAAGALLEVAAGMFRSQVPRWRDTVAEMVSNARHALAGEFG